MDGVVSKQIKPLTIDHYEDILRVWLDSGLPIRRNGRDSREGVAKEMSHDFVEYQGLFIDGRLVGVAIAQFEGRRGWISRLAILPDYRGIGLASDLIEACERFLGKYGEELVISALIEDENTPSMSCFGRAGYECWPHLQYWSKRPRKDL